MKGNRECWLTSVFNWEDCLSALVLAKSLKGVLTSKPLVVLVSSLVPDAICVLLEQEFEQCIRIRIEGNPSDQVLVGGKFLPEIYCWNLVHWNKVVYLNPNCLVTKNCDEIFRKKGFAYCNLDDLDVFVLEPSFEVWKQLMAEAPTQSFHGTKTLSSVLGIGEDKKNDGTGSILERGYNFTINLDINSSALLIPNLNEIRVTKFTGVKPMEILFRRKTNTVTGLLEKAVMDLWKMHFEQGVAEHLAKYKVENIHLTNGLQEAFMEYRRETIFVPSPVPTVYRDDYKNAVAIIGIGCRMPSANNLDEFWKLLIEGKDAIGICKDGRWDSDKCSNFSEESKQSQAGYLSCPIDEFDAKFFGMSPMELSFTDPQQRLMTQIAWEALEDAAVDPLSLQGTYTGVFGGSWRQDYRDLMVKAGVDDKEFLRTYLGNSYGVLSARISHCLGLTGPSITTESGCSSSIVAVDMACKSLLRGETDLTLACGVNLLLHPFTVKSMNTVLAPDAHCKTFDASADGFARAEGCGVLVLKRYADAVKDGDRVHALIRGSAVVQEGASRSLGTPTKYCEALAMKLALEDAHVQPKDVSYVETHGTGTAVGDPLEIAAVTEVYSKERNTVLTIGSVKTNIGHTESVSGIAGIIKVVLSMKNEIIPPHRNFNALNPAIDLEVIPAKIPLKPLEWRQDPRGPPRIAGVSSFGITGTDAHAIIQEAPDASRHPQLSTLIKTTGFKRPQTILTASAKTPEALEQSLKQCKAFLEKTDESLENIAFTANAGRGHFPFRTAIVGSTNTEILENMKNCVKKQAPEESPKICFLFTGQGSQYSGMAKDLYDHSPTFQMHFDECDRILQKGYGVCIKDALWGNNSASIGRTIYSQTSIFCVEYCLLKLWESWGIKPDFVLGHSLGEFAAAVGAGILKFEDALKLVAERSRLIDDLPGGKMLVLKESAQKVDAMLKTVFKDSKGWLDTAAVNSPEQTVVSGDEVNVKIFAEYCRSNEIKTHILDATHAFHSRHMDPILEKYRQVASGVKYQKPTCTYISGMDGIIMTEDTHVDAEYWVRHTRDMVRFSDASKAAIKSSCNLFLEVGPQPVLSALTLMNSDGLEDFGPIMCLPSIRKQEEGWLTILTSLGKLYLSGMKIDWKTYDQFSKVEKVSLPSYPFQNKPYWFELPEGDPDAIHPIVGSQVSNASDIKLFTNKLHLDDAEFLRDHTIGSEIIFPGAGFLEMCLVSGHSAIQCTEASYSPPLAPITIENFTIESPLRLDSKKTTQMQTVVATEDSGETRVTVYSKLILDKETQKWIRHASGTFSPFTSDLINTTANSENNLDAIKGRCQEKIQMVEIYESLGDCGLKFGPTFRTLQSTSRNSASNEAIFELSVTDNPERFICHPVVSDAMLQATMIFTNPDSTKLHVPVAINKFVWLSKIDSETCYIHCYVDSNDGTPASDTNVTATLYSSSGTPLARMVGAQFMETSVSSVLSALEAQRLSLPGMYEDTWRNQLGPLEKRANLELFPAPWMFDRHFIQETCSRCEIDADGDYKFIKESDNLCTLYILKGLYDLGWVPKVGEVYEFNNLMTSFNVISSLVSFFRYMLIELAAEGFFAIKDENRENMKFQLINVPPSIQQILKDIDKLYNELRVGSRAEIEFVSSTGRILASFLTGKESALSYLFPSDQNQVSAEDYYDNSRSFRSAKLIYDLYISELFKVVTPHLQEKQGVLRILEVGAGTGTATKSTVPHLLHLNSNIEYTYTDLSPAFFQNGKKIFENSQIKVHYKLLNIEEDPVTQGFIPHHYDMIIACHVIHATKDISNTLGNIRNLLTDEGVLMISEATKPHRIINLTFGLLPTYWAFTDFNLRPYNCEISAEKYENVLKSQNFTKVVSFITYQGLNTFTVAKANRSSEYFLSPSLRSLKEDKAWVLFLDDDDKIGKYFQEHLRGLGNQVITVTRSNSKFTKTNELSYSLQPDDEVAMSTLFNSICETSHFQLTGVVFLWGVTSRIPEDEDNYSQLILPFLNLCKVLSPITLPKFYVLTRGIANFGDFDVSLPIPSSPLFAMLKAFENELDGQVSCRCIDLVLDNDNCSLSDIELQETFAELFIDDNERCVAYRNNQRNVCRLTSWKTSNTALTLPQSGRFQLILPSSKAIRDLRFGLDEKQVLKGSEIEIEIKAWALNFRDVFVVLKPSAEFETMKVVGIDYAGVVVRLGPNASLRKIGDPVFGCSPSVYIGKAIPSHLTVAEELTMVIPSNTMTYFDAATLPAVATTVYLSLIDVAKLKAEDTILIHTASGGVGLVAIQVAKAIGAKIVATAGSKRKQAYLKHLGIEHVFHSRNTNYGEEIGKALNGGGVDVVLNSLTGPGFKEASLSVCNHGARFIEMSKLNVWSPEEAKALRPDVNYQIVDLSAATNDEMSKLLRKLQSLIMDSTIQPIPYVRFDVTEIREALTFLQKAKHIGKIVCAMPHSDGIVGGGRVMTPSIPMFSNGSTYIITGGLGGIGFEVAKWMCNSGAKHIVLVGRNPPDEKNAREIEQMNSKGKNVVAVQFDIGNLDNCKDMLESINSGSFPPVRGIMHAAGVLSDATYPNQTWDKYETVYNPKVKGGWNLHQLTLNYSLEHFVMFSSVASSFGGLGQSNHASANSFLDALAYYRNSIGLPATTIKWGQWGQVGVAADKNLEVIGVRPFSVLQGISALEKILKCQKLEASVLEIDIDTVKVVFKGSKLYLQDLKAKNKQDASKLEVAISQDQFWKDFDSALSAEGKLGILRNCLRSVTKQILMLNSEDVINDDENFQDYGMDSLMMIEMKNMVQSVFGSRITITANSLKDTHTINELSAKLLDLLCGGDDDDGTVLSTEDLHKLVQDDSLLPSKIKPASIPYCKPSEIRSVLLTGATGTLGSYVLRDLTNRSHIEKVYCLIKDGKTNPLDKLKKVLELKSLLKQTLMEKVVCITGSVTKPNLGLDAETYEELSLNTDAVVHLAVKKSFGEVYKNLEKNENNPRNVIVKGTLNLLEFATSMKTKLFFHASDILINLRANESGKSMSETWPTPDDFQELPNFAYHNSKLVCDRLMAQAVERGLPVKVFRFPVIAGDSKTGGNISYEDNQLIIRLMTYLHLGSIPALPIPLFLLPVDICSELSLKIFFKDEAPFDIFNVYNPISRNEIDFVSVAKELGYKPMEVLEFSKFMEKVEGADDSKAIVTKEIFGRKHALKMLSTDTPALIQCWVESPKTTFFSKKLAQFLPGYPNGFEDPLTIIKRDLAYAKSLGVIKT